MATIVPKIFPVDTQPRVAIGVSVPFSGPAVFNSTYQTKDQIKSNLINYFLTNKGERYLNPNFGGNLRATLFEQISEQTLSGLEVQIQADLSVFFPMVRVISLQVKEIINENIINVILDYSVYNSPTENIELNFSA
jgi:phage baseplate assembly protein W